MIVQRFAERIETWYIAFSPVKVSRLCRLVPGRWKHVMAFAPAVGTQAWLFVDVNLYGACVYLIPKTAAGDAKLVQYLSGCSILRMRANPPSRWRWPLTFGCVGAVKHLLNLRGALMTPRGLWNLMLQNGAVIVHDEQHAGHSASVDRSHAAGAAGGGD